MRRTKKSPAQIQHNNEALALANLARARRVFRLAGHYDFEKRIEAVADEFKTKLKSSRAKHDY